MQQDQPRTETQIIHLPAPTAVAAGARAGSLAGADGHGDQLALSAFSARC